MPAVFVEPGDQRFTRGLAALARQPTFAKVSINAVSSDIINDLIEAQPAFPDENLSRYEAGQLVRITGAPGTRQAGELVEGSRAPDTMVVGPEHVEPDWLTTEQLLDELGYGPKEHQKLYAYVDAGTLETYYVLPHLKRMFVIVDRTKLLARDALRRLRGEKRNTFVPDSVSLVKEGGHPFIVVKKP